MPGARHEPGTSESAVFGGHSNWRGPVWMPVNMMLIEALPEFERFYRDEFQLECPTSSERSTTLGGVATRLPVDPKRPGKSGRNPHPTLQAAAKRA